MNFYSRRFETELVGQFHFGDIVVDSYGGKAIVIKEPYKIGHEPIEFTLIYYGRSLRSVRVEDLKKTGKSCAKELNTIFEELKRGRNHEVDN